MKRVLVVAAAVVGIGVSGGGHAAILGVNGGPSSTGAAAEIIQAPSNVLDDYTVNVGMQGFDEAQGVTTTGRHEVDGGTRLAGGLRVDSHMIMLNSDGFTRITHSDVTWTFSGEILGIMSDRNGHLEAASSALFGAHGTQYIAPPTDPGQDAPFRSRGLEHGDQIVSIDGNSLTLSLVVTEPGDWIRVITRSAVPGPVFAVVPEPATLGLLVAGLAAAALIRNRRRI
jgi:hypothetical protein